jgi:CRISPR/Cas system-associated protein endoribonuclease Cas2
MSSFMLNNTTAQKKAVEIYKEFLIKIGYIMYF